MKRSVLLGLSGSLLLAGVTAIPLALYLFLEPQEIVDEPSGETGMSEARQIELMQEIGYLQQE